MGREPLESLPLLTPVRSLGHAPPHQRQRHLVVGTIAFGVLLTLMCVVTLPLQPLKRFYLSGGDDKRLQWAMRRDLEGLVGTHGFTGVVRVTRNDQVLFESALGFANEESHVHTALNQQFPLGVSSELLCSVSLYVLQEQAKLNVSEPVHAFMNDKGWQTSGVQNQGEWCEQECSQVPREVCEEVTVAELLSGVCSFPFISNNESSLSGNLSNLPTELPEAVQPHGSPASAALLENVVEIVSGQAYQAFVKEHVLDKIGMRNTLVGARPDPAYSVNQYVRGLVLEADENLVQITTEQCKDQEKHGGVEVYSTVADQRALHMDLFSDRGKRSKVLSERSLQQLVSLGSQTTASGRAHGVFVTYDDASTTITSWPSLVHSCARTGCATTCVITAPQHSPVDVGDDLALPGETVVACVFSNSVGVVFQNQSSLTEWQNAGGQPPDSDFTVINFTSTLIQDAVRG